MIYSAPKIIDAKHILITNPPGVNLRITACTGQSSGLLKLKWIMKPRTVCGGMIPGRPLTNYYTGDLREFYGEAA